MKNFLFIASLLLSAQLFGQSSSLWLDFKGLQSDSGYTFYILKEIDTVYMETFEKDCHRFVENLENGIHNVCILNKRQELVLEEMVILLPDQFVTVQSDLAYIQNLSYQDTTVYRQRNEIQLSFGYFNARWQDKSSMLRNNFSYGFTYYYWNSFSKHVGVLAGGGFGISQHSFHKDTTSSTLVPLEKRRERYTNILLNYELKFRYSFRNQQIGRYSLTGFFIDLGAGYYFPVIFNHATVYEGHKKLIDKRIHDYTDFRAFVNIGFHPVSFFLEYRLSDFIRGNYPQLPKCHAGLRIMIHDENHIRK